MSKEIDLEKPLSDEDRAWLHERSLDHVIAENDRKFKAEEEPEEPEVSPEGGVDYPSPADAARPFEEGSEPVPKFAQRPFDRQVSSVFSKEPIVGESDVNGGEDADDDLNTWTVEELKDELRAQDLPTSGNKDELVARLRKAE